MDVSIVKQKVIKAQKIIQSLKDVALEDGEISEEERKLILNIGRNLEGYFSIVKNSAVDSLSQNEELHIMEKRILQDAQAQALEDGLLSKEEKKLLAELITLMEEITNLRD